MIISNRMIMYKLLGLDRNNWNHTTVSNLFVFDKNAWHNSMQKKQIKEKHHKKQVHKCKYNYTMNMIH